MMIVKTWLGEDPYPSGYALACIDYE